MRKSQKRQLDLAKEAQSRKVRADATWDHIMLCLGCGEKIDQERISIAMSRCNEADSFCLLQGVKL